MSAALERIDISAQISKDGLMLMLMRRGEIFGKKKSSGGHERFRVEGEVSSSSS